MKINTWYPIKPFFHNYYTKVKIENSISRIKKEPCFILILENQNKERTIFKKDGWGAKYQREWKTKEGIVKFIKSQIGEVNPI